MDTIKLYSTPSCVYCNTLKMYFKKYNFDFEDIDVSKNEKELDQMIEKSGQMGVPVIEIGKEVITGFDVGAIKKALKLK